MGARRDSGSVRRLPSGRWQARYPDSRGTLRAAPQTFRTRAEASSYLAAVHTEQNRGSWVDPAAGQLAFGDYAADWLKVRELRPRTRELYAGLLANHLPTFAGVPLAKIAPLTVRTWRAERLAAGIGDCASLSMRSQVSSGSLLREARRRAAMSQVELGKRAGVTQSVISAYESGSRQPSLVTLERLVAATGLEVDVQLRRPASRLARLSGPLGRRIRAKRHEVRNVVASHGLANVRVFGSVLAARSRPTVTWTCSWTYRRGSGCSTSPGRSRSSRPFSRPRSLSSERGTQS